MCVCLCVWASISVYMLLNTHLPFQYSEKNILIFSRRSRQAHSNLSCSGWNPHFAENYTTELKFKPISIYFLLAS